MFEWLFKFERVHFTTGEIGLQAGSTLYAVGALLALLLVVFGVIYFTARIYTSDRNKAVSLGLRVAALLLLCLPLLEPVLVSPDVVPNESFVVVMMDASASMALPDGTLAPTRGEDAQRLLLDDRAGGGLLAAIDKRFKLRRYVFAERAHQVDGLQQMRFEGRTTNLSAALKRVLADFKGRPLAGIVLLTDGGDNSTGSPLAMAGELRDVGVPLHVVGLGRETFEQEREIVDVRVSNDVEVTTKAEIDVRVRSWKAGPARFSIYRGEEQVFSTTRRLKGDGKIDQLTFFYEPEEEAPREYILAVEKAPEELNVANNAIPILIDTRKDPIRVLYFEGQLRPDFKFIKRALEDDRYIEVASVLHTGTGKLYRQGVKSPNEMKGGFPRSEAALYDFEVVILGDIAVSQFAVEQLQAVRQFVRHRGGGFVMLGGRHAFTEGNYMNTPVADLLPVRLDPGRRKVIPPDFTGPDTSKSGFRFAPTPAGLEHPILKLAAREDSSRARWSSVPRLRSINYLGSVKPGAIVLAEKPEDVFGGREPLLVVQRYGAGRSAALPTASTWRWQLQLPAEDMRHERFWRQLVRWLAASATGPVDLDLARRLAPGNELQATVRVYDENYDPLSGASVRGRLTGPSGRTRSVSFRQKLADAGTYAAAFAPQAEGIYALEVTARTGQRVIGRHVQHFLVRPSQNEFRDATLKRSFLEQLAEASGGMYYEPVDVDAIPVNLRSKPSRASVYRTAYLWDMPLLFGLVILLLSIEWIYRRRQGLP